MPLSRLEDDQMKKYLMPQLTLDDVQKSTTSFDDSMERTLAPAVASPTPPIGEDREMAIPDGNATKVEDSNPGHSQEDLDKYISGQKNQIDKYGPDQEKMVLDQILKERRSLPRVAGGALSTFADAVAGAAGQGSNYAGQLEDSLSKEDQMRLDSTSKLQAMNEKNMGAKQTLDSMTSSSPLGASQVAPLAAFFEKVGIPKSEIPKILQNPVAARSIVEPFATIMTSEDKIKMETLLKELELGFQKQKLASDTATADEKQNIDKNRLAADAAEKRSKLGIIDKAFLHRDEAKLLENQMKGGESRVVEDGVRTFSSDEEARKAGLEDGAPIIINGVKGKWYN